METDRVLRSKYSKENEVKVSLDSKQGTNSEGTSCNGSDGNSKANKEILSGERILLMLKFQSI